MCLSETTTRFNGEISKEIEQIGVQVFYFSQIGFSKQANSGKVVDVKEVVGYVSGKSSSACDSIRFIAISSGISCNLFLIVSSAIFSSFFSVKVSFLFIAGLH